MHTEMLYTLLQLRLMSEGYDSMSSYFFAAQLLLGFAALIGLIMFAIAARQRELPNYEYRKRRGLYIFGFSLLLLLCVWAFARKAKNDAEKYRQDPIEFYEQYSKMRRIEPKE